MDAEDGTGKSCLHGMNVGPVATLVLSTGCAKVSCRSTFPQRYVV